MKPDALKNLSELRSCLEGFAARLAATRAASSPNQICQMRTMLKHLRETLVLRDYPAFLAADLELHQAIIELAAVPKLMPAWRLIWDALAEFHCQGFQDYYPDARVLADEHEHLIETIALGDPVAAEDAARSHVEAVWFRVAEPCTTDAGTLGDPLRRAEAHLAFQLHCPLKLSDVADKVAFTSAGNLSRLFKLRHGVSFKAYLQNLRLDKACDLLRVTQMPVARIARRVGYKDASRFCQHFKRRFKTTPANYRTRIRPSAQTPCMESPDFFSTPEVAGS